MTTHSMIDLSVYPTDYGDAVSRWKHAMSGQTGFYRFYPLAGPKLLSPDGEALITQVAWLGDENADKVLALIAGTHGIEGFVGTAIQLDFLRRPRSFNGMGVLLVHALTPWGYAWYRRCDENGVDLNRNFIDFACLPANPGFHQLQSYVLHPEKQIREQAFTAFKSQYGQEAFELAISGGQYTHPDAPFYGGRQPNHGHQVINKLIDEFNLAKRQLAVIDLHTGLGPYAYGEVICDHPLESVGLDTALKWYGAAVTVPQRGTSSSVPKQGLLDYAWHRIMRDGSCFITLEFGTYGIESLFEVLFRDHKFWSGTAVGGTNDPDWMSEWRMVSEEMRLHFYPPDPVWREAVLFRGRQVVGQAIAGLQR